MAHEYYDEEYINNCPDGRCSNCGYARVVTAQDQWQFLGCYCKPYTGRWVAEIKDCPKDDR